MLGNKMSEDYSNIFKKFNFKLSCIRYGVPSSEYTAKSVLNKFNGVHPVICFKKGGGYTDYSCDNKLLVRVYDNGKATLEPNNHYQVSPANHIKLTEGEITNEN